MKSPMASVASLAAATVKHSGHEGELPEPQLREIVNVVSNVSKRQISSESKNRVLWVDDCPENNIYERQAFQAQGIEFSLALSTNEALDILKTSKFAVIISDMERKEGPQEGYALLDKLRSLGDTTPFVIYTSSNFPEHKRQHGTIGSTNRADELFRLVTGIIANGS